MKTSVYKLSLNTFVAVPAGQPAPVQFQRNKPVLFKELELTAGQDLIALDTDQALSDIAKQGWHHWKVKVDMDVRP